MKESKVEGYFNKQVELAGGEVRKLNWINRRGAPDRLAMLKGPHFVELKAPGKKPEPHQVREHSKMRKHGLRVYVIDTLEGVDRFIKEITSNEKEIRSKEVSGHYD